MPRWEYSYEQLKEYFESNKENLENELHIKKVETLFAKMEITLNDIADIIDERVDFLPKEIEVIIRKEELESDDIEEELDEMISEYLSDEYGYCHNGFNYEIINEHDEEFEIRIFNIKWDATEG